MVAILAPKCSSSKLIYSTYSAPYEILQLKHNEHVQDRNTWTTWNPNEFWITTGSHYFLLFTYANGNVSWEHQVNYRQRSVQTSLYRDRMFAVENGTYRTLSHDGAPSLPDLIHVPRHASSILILLHEPNTYLSHTKKIFLIRFIGCISLC